MLNLFRVLTHFSLSFTPVRVGSAPCRAVQMTAAAVGADLKLKLTNLMTGEHMKPEYIAVSLIFLTQMTLKCTQYTFKSEITVKIKHMRFSNLN
jgi:type IV pilus biogenesis protein CpaD/CtpE